MTSSHPVVSLDGVHEVRNTDLSAPTTSPLPGRSDWQGAYLRRLQVSDAVVVVFAVAAAAIVRFGPSPLNAFAVDTAPAGYIVLSLILAGAWLGLLAVSRSRSPRIIGSGAEEYRRVVAATVQLFGAIAIVCLVFQIDLARGYLAVALPTGLLGLLFTRRAWRVRGARMRARGEMQTSVLVVGASSAALALASSFERDSSIGYTVVGICMPGHSGEMGEKVTIAGRDVPIFGDEHSVVDALSFCRADTVAVTATEQLGPKGIRDLVWALDPFDVDLVVAPGVVDVSGPRLMMRPVAGLPLIHVEKPQYNGAKRFGKTAFDFLFAIAALIVTAPLFLLVALAIKIDSRGPVFYRSERIGLDGTSFGMIKFRSMVTDADKRLDTLLESNESEGGVLFKMRDDPRVTRVGRIIRRLSMDELPQFLNVLRREMSVVGPRPPLRREVATYDGHVRRRLLVKPGITGLWQVAGRSDLSWEESVRLDLSYVENWSMVGDLLIVVKTVKAVAQSSGAY